MRSNKNKGFTLIELLTVIAILAIVLLIAVPTILNVLDKAKRQALIDSGISIVKTFDKLNTTSDALGETHIVLPDGDQVVNVDLNDINYENGGNVIGHIRITSVDGNYRYYLNITDGEYSICDIEYTSVNSNDVVKGKCEPFIDGDNGDAVELGGYNWHIIGQDDTKIWLLMDSKQLPTMNHCTDDLDPLTDCGVYTSNSTNYYSYSWDKSLIRQYLNGEFYNNLIGNDNTILNKIFVSDVCSNSSVAGSWLNSYGGYTKEEIDTLISSGISASCSGGYVSDKVRLISMSEYRNISSYYTDEQNSSNNIPNLSYMTRLASNSWLFNTNSNGVSTWWTMSSYSCPNDNCGRHSRFIAEAGPIYDFGSSANNYIHPVIVLYK